MKLPAVAITLALIPMQLHAGAIAQKSLDEFVVYNLPVAFKSGNTTVLFPSAISGLYAKSVAVQEQANADFLISFTPGNFYFTVRALKPTADDHLTVIHNRKAYVLHLTASEQPLYTVTFFQDRNSRETLRLILMLALCSGCATRKAAEPPSIPKTMPQLSAPETREVRTAEIVKAYPVGRYSDPDFPEAMHERHSLYRREQAAEWNYRPSNSYALPLGPVVAESNPLPSYYVKTNAEQMNAQQRAYAEALLEQNRALNQRIQDLQKQDSTIQNLQEEIERLKKERETQPHADAPAPEKASPQPTPETQEGFSALDGGPLPEEDSISDPGDLILFPRCEEDYGAFLISQMRLNSELSQQLDAIVRRRLALLITGSRFPLNYTFNTPTP